MVTRYCTLVQIACGDEMHSAVKNNANKRVEVCLPATRHGSSLSA
jgi:hypothetical protein